MKRWRLILASVLIVCGMSYMCYSGTRYLQKCSVIEDLTSLPKVLGKTEKIPWVTYSKEERPKVGEYFATLMIPRFKIQVPIIEGTGDEELAWGVGHYLESALPGEANHAVLSGHRDTLFQRMDRLKKGDLLYVKTDKGTFIYRITRMWITDPEDRSVIVPLKKPVLTLTTCYPFTYVGPAPKRYIIQSELEQKVV